MRNIDTLLDRIILASGVMTATIYLLAFVAITYRITVYRVYGRPNRLATIAPLHSSDVQSIMWSCAAAFMALFVRYSATAMARLERIDWGSITFDALALSCDVVMITAATYSIYAASRSICGYRCAAVFFLLSLFPGGILYLWS